MAGWNGSSPITVGTFKVSIYLFKILIHVCLKYHEQTNLFSVQLYLEGFIDIAPITLST